MQLIRRKRRCNAACDVLCYGIAKFVGGYVAAMNGVDAIVFTAGIGENAIPVRERLCISSDILELHLIKKQIEIRGEDNRYLYTGFQS